MAVGTGCRTVFFLWKPTAMPTQVTLIMVSVVVTYQGWLVVVIYQVHLSGYILSGYILLECNLTGVG